MPNEHLQSALAYANAGLAVFPCRLRDEGTQKSKSPYTVHGFKNASTNENMIKCWWSEHPDATIGIPTGQISNLVVIDIDPRNGGDHSLQGLTTEYNDLPETLTAYTGGGGTHYYFRHPNQQIRCSNGKLASGIDVKADGGYVIVPPSGHESGKNYYWDGDFDLNTVAEMPNWLLNLIETKSEQPSSALSETENGILEGSRNNTLTSLAGKMRQFGMGESEIFAALSISNQQRCKPPLPEAEIQAIAKSVCRYEPDQASVIMVEGTPGVDLSGILAQPDQSNQIIDPGQLPDEFMRVPGFVSELMDFSLQTAPYPNQGLAFCGALAMQSFLCGRKIRDAGNLRTNIYLLALAGSSSGKDWPRQANAHIMMEINKHECLGDKFSSGEGIQDAMLQTPSMLFQNDEIDGILISLNKSRDGRFESIMSTLLTMYTSSGSVYPMRRKAGKESAGIIDQPHLSIFGTATPKYYYESLSERMLSNGFFARMMVIDIGYRGKGQDAGLIDQMPDRLLETAQWWDQFCPGQQRGNLIGFHPTPIVVTATYSATQILNEFRFRADEEYTKAEADNDECAKSIWGRANENARKLALLYAASERYEAPSISEQAAKWAVDFVDHQIRRMLYLTTQHVYENEFDKKCKRMIQLLTAWHKQNSTDSWMPHWELGRRLKGWSESDFEKVREALAARYEIEYAAGSTPKGGRVGYRYRLC